MRARPVLPIQHAQQMEEQLEPMELGGQLVRAAEVIDGMQLIE